MIFYYLAELAAELYGWLLWYAIAATLVSTALVVTLYLTRRKE